MNMMNKWFNKIKKEKKKITKKTWLRSFAIFAIILTFTVVSSITFSDASTVLYESEDGIEYTEDDLFTSTTMGECKWNISYDGESDLWAYIFLEKDANDQPVTHPDADMQSLVLVITGTETQTFDIEKSYWFEENVGFRYVYRDKVESVTSPDKTAWFTDGVIPWSYLSDQEKQRIGKGVIDDFCNPSSYAFFFGGFGTKTEVIFETGAEYDLKIPTDLSGMLYNNWSDTFIMPECVWTDDVTNADKMFWMHDGLEYIDLSHCNFGSLESATNFCTKSSSLYACGEDVKQIMLPNSINTEATIQIEDELNYYNYDGSTYTKLKLGTSESGTTLLDLQFVGVKDMDGNASDLEINCMKTDDYEYSEAVGIYTDSNGNVYTLDDLDEYYGDGMVLQKSRWNISEDNDSDGEGDSDLWANVFIIKNSNPEKRMFVITGTSEDIMDFEYSYDQWDDMYYYPDNYNGEAIFYNKDFERVTVDGITSLNMISKWREKKITPWSIAYPSMVSSIDQITKIIISKEANPKSYDFLGTSFLVANDFIIEPFEDGSDKKVYSMCGTLANTDITTYEFPSYLDTSDVTDISNLFYNADYLRRVDFTNFTSDDLTAIHGLFYGACYCDSMTGIEDLDVSNVDDFSHVFDYASNNMYSGYSPIDLDLSKWDTSNATTFESMFEDAYISSLNVSNFNVENATNFSNMFNHCSYLEKLDLSKWEINETEAINFDSMFKEMDDLELLFLNKWKIKSADTTTDMFTDTDVKYIKLPLSIDTVSITTPNLEYFNSTGTTLTPLTIGGNTSGTTLLDQTAVDDLSSLNANIMKAPGYEYLTIYTDENGNEYTSSDLANYYDYGYNLQQTRWNISDSGTGDLWANIFKVKGKTDEYILVFTGTDTDIFEFKSAVSDREYNEAKNVDTIWETYSYYPVDAWNFYKYTPWSLWSNFDKITKVVISSECKPDNFNLLCCGLCNAEELVIEGNAKRSPTSMKFFITSSGIKKITGAENLDVSNMTDLSYAFYCAWSLQELDMSEWDVSNVTNFSYMFSCCPIKHFDISMWDVSKGTNFEGMFRSSNYWYDFFIDIPCWDVSNGENFKEMFAQNAGLEILNLRDWDVSKGTDFTNFTFNDCLQYLNIENASFNVTDQAKVENAFGPFPGFVVLPKFINPAITLKSSFNRGDIFGFYNKNNGIITRLKYNGNEWTDKIFAKTNENLTKHSDNEPYNGTLNVMFQISSYIEKWPLVQKVNLEDKNFDTDDTLDIEINYDKWIEYRNKKTPKLLFTFEGEGNTIGNSNVAEASFKELKDDFTLVFTYTIKSTDKVNKGSKIKLIDLENYNQFIHKTNGYMIEPPRLTESLGDSFSINYVEPTPQGGGGSSHKKKPEEPKPIEEPQPVEEPKSKKAIMQGYEDKTFKPENFVSREEVAAIFARALEGFNEDENFKDFSDFKDADGRWSENYLGFLKSKELVQGYADGTYRPTENMTRAELCVLITNFEEFRDSDAGALKAHTSFPDAQNRWFEPYVKKLEALGIIIGYDDGEFKGDRYVSRVEVAIILNRINNRNVKEIPNEFAEKVTENFKDISKDSWYFKEVAEATLDLPEEWFK